MQDGQSSSQKFLNPSRPTTIIRLRGVSNSSAAMKPLMRTAALFAALSRVRTITPREGFLAPRLFLTERILKTNHQQDIHKVYPGNIESWASSTEDIRADRSQSDIPS